MRARAIVGEVARRELRERLRERSFFISTGVSLAIVIAVILIAGGGPSTYEVGVVGERAERVVAAAAAQEEAFGLKIEAREFESPEQARAAVRDGELDAAVAEGRIVGDDEVDESLMGALQTGAREVAAREALAERGITGADADRVLAPPALEVALLDPPDGDADDREGFAFLTAIVLYGALIGFGYTLAAGIVEEKASRVIEVILAAVRPWQLLTGKVLGIGLLGLGQITVIGAVGLAVAQATGAFDAASTLSGPIGVSLLFFLLGYLLYACVFAVAGAIVPRQEELQNSMTPVTLLLLASFMFTLAVVGQEPDGTAARVATFVPPAAPMVTPMRHAFGEAATWEIVLSAGSVLAGCALLIPLAARIYAGGLLGTSRRVRLADAWRAATTRG